MSKDLIMVLEDSKEQIGNRITTIRSESILASSQRDGVVFEASATSSKPVAKRAANLTYPRVRFIECIDGVEVDLRKGVVY